MLPSSSKNNMLLWKQITARTNEDSLLKREAVIPQDNNSEYKNSRNRKHWKLSAKQQIASTSWMMEKKVWFSTKLWTTNNSMHIFI